MTGFRCINTPVFNINHSFKHQEVIYFCGSVHDYLHSDVDENFTRNSIHHRQNCSTTDFKADLLTTHCCCVMESTTEKRVNVIKDTLWQLRRLEPFWTKSLDMGNTFLRIGLNNT